uniref:hypothetical protein n=1 Tax=Microbispora cellulosiformans TaxID=2614688 RepID=UPI001CD9AC2F|nr:hypothetical protein [Microbispora cellulosiformans]
MPPILPRTARARRAGCHAGRPCQPGTAGRCGSRRRTCAGTSPAAARTGAAAVCSVRTAARGWNPAAAHAWSRTSARPLPGACEHRLAQPVGVGVLEQPDPYVRMRAVPGPQGRGQHAQAHRVEGRDLELARLQPRRLPRRAPCPFRAGERGPGVGQHGAPHRSGPGAYHALLEMTDATLPAKATVWAATDERCANQAFNVNNGDLFRWEEMWPAIARFFGLEVAPPLPMSLEAVMADKEPLWNSMVERHGLAKHSYQEVSSWRFGDAVFSWDYDFIADGSKARRFGFPEFADTRQMFLDIFADFRRRRIIP